MSSKAATAKTELRWAKVAYQPDMQNPRDPIPLGVVVWMKRGSETIVAIMGKVPSSVEQPPPEFRDAGRLGLTVLTSWVTAMTGEVRSALARRQDPMERLCATFRYNLFVTEFTPRKTRQKERPLRDYIVFSIVADLYERYVGEAAPGRLSPRKKSSQGTLRKTHSDYQTLFAAA